MPSPVPSGLSLVNGSNSLASISAEGPGPESLTRARGAAGWIADYCDADEAGEGGVAAKRLAALTPASQREREKAVACGDGGGRTGGFDCVEHQVDEQLHDALRVADDPDWLRRPLELQLDPRVVAVRPHQRQRFDHEPRPNPIAACSADSAVDPA